MLNVLCAFTDLTKKLALSILEKNNFIALKEKNK